MDRRQFLRMGTGLVATATMVEAGQLAEFLDWLRRNPKSAVMPHTFEPKFYSITVDLRHPWKGAQERKQLRRAAMLDQTEIMGTFWHVDQEYRDWFISEATKERP